MYDLFYLFVVPSQSKEGGGGKKMKKKSIYPKNNFGPVAGNIQHFCLRSYWAALLILDKFQISHTGMISVKQNMNIPLEHIILAPFNFGFIWEKSLFSHATLILTRNPSPPRPRRYHCAMLDSIGGRRSKSCFCTF